MKRIFALLLAMLLVVSLVACGGSQEPAATEAPAANAGAAEQAPTLAGQTVSMVIWGSEERKASFEEVLAPFTEETGINVEITLIPEGEIVTKVSAQIAAGKSYDISWMNESVASQFIQTGNLEDISVIMEDEEYDFEDLSQSIMDLYKKDGKLYAVPFTASPRVWFYNKNLIAQANLEDPQALAARGEWTYDKMLEYSQAIHDLGSNYFGFCNWNYTVPNAWNIYLDWLWAYGGDFFDDNMTVCLANTPETIGVLETYKNCIETGLTPTPDSSIDFATGQVGFTRNAVSYGGTLTDIDFEWDIIPNPTGPVENSATMIGTAVYTVPKGAPHKEAAIEVIKFLTSKEGMSDDFIMGNWNPLRESVLSSEKYLNREGGVPSAEGLRLAMIEPMSGNTRRQYTSANYNELDLKVKEILSSWLADEYESTAAMCADMEAQLTALIEEG